MTLQDIVDRLQEIRRIHINGQIETSLGFETVDPELRAVNVAIKLERLLFDLGLELNDKHELYEKLFSR